MFDVESEQKLPIELIMDGEVIKDNLEQNNITVPWLESELKKRHLSKSDVVYAVLAANGNMYVDTYRDHIRYPIDKE